MQIPKGKKSREEILDHVRIALNEEGLNLTLADTAKKLNSTLGRITYHFPTKDDLYIALAQEYQTALDQLITDAKPAQSDILLLINLAPQIMDLQFKYSCVMRFVAATVKQQRDLSRHIALSFKNDKDKIIGIIQSSVNTGRLKKEILEPFKLESVIFQFTGLFSAWVINFEVYDSDKSYEQLKPVYLHGILSCFTPYLTNKGKKDMKMILPL
jgi:AcrR family transcriptional regulator